MGDIRRPICLAAAEQTLARLRDLVNFTRLGLPCLDDYTLIRVGKCALILITREFRGYTCGLPQKSSPVVVGISWVPDTVCGTKTLERRVPFHDDGGSNVDRFALIHVSTQLIPSRLGVVNVLGCGDDESSAGARDNVKSFNRPRSLPQTSRILHTTSMYCSYRS